MEYSVEWDEQLGLATCIIFDHNDAYYGLATCHENDKDFKSKLTGQHIAYLRARKQYLQAQKKEVIKPKLAVVKEMYVNMTTSKFFNEKSYEAKMLRRKISQLEKELATTNCEIDRLQTELMDYINEKDAMYKDIRARRSNKDN